MLEMNIKISDSDDCCTLGLSLKASCDGCSRHLSVLVGKKKNRTVRNVCTKPWGENFKNHRFQMQRDKYNHAWMEIEESLSPTVQLKTSTNNLETVDGNETNQDDHSHVLRPRKRKEHLAPHVSPLSVHTFDNIYIFNLCSYCYTFVFLFQSHTKTQKVNKGGKQKVKRKKTEQDRQENGTARTSVQPRDDAPHSPLAQSRTTGVFNTAKNVLLSMRKKRKESHAPNVSRLSVHTFDNIYIFNLCS